MVQIFILESFVHSQFWCETLSSIVHLINILPSFLVNHVSPYTRLFGHPLYYYNNLCIFSYVCGVHFLTREHTKLLA